MVKPWFTMVAIHEQPCSNCGPAAGVIMQGCKLSLFDQFYLVVQKVRVGTLNKVLADSFNISQTTVSMVFISWITFLYFMLGNTCVWPSWA